MLEDTLEPMHAFLDALRVEFETIVNTTCAICGWIDMCLIREAAIVKCSHVARLSQKKLTSWTQKLVHDCNLGLKKLVDARPSTAGKTQAVEGLAVKYRRHSQVRVLEYHNKEELKRAIATLKKLISLIYHQQVYAKFGVTAAAVRAS